MSGEDLGGLGLSGAILERCNLRRARLEGADLSRTDLFKADLRQCSLTDANLQEASLGEANLEGSWLVRANMRGARLLSARLSGAALTEADLEGAVLWGADLRSAHLHWARMQRADLRGADLRGADLVGADARDAILWDANLVGTTLSDADLRKARLQNADLSRAHLEFAALESTDLSRIKSMCGAFVYGTRWGDNFLEMEKLGPRVGEEEDGEYLRAAAAYMALCRLYRDSPKPWAASWAYMKARTMGRKAVSPRYARPALGQHTVRWMGDWLAELTCGYGEKPGRPLVWAGAALAVFPLLYRMSGGVVLGTGNAPSWLGLFTYSIATFATLKLDGFRVVTATAQLLSSLQSLLGLMLLGLALHAFGRQAARR
jgi:uncharacterized protein YjbI with pentapeptide repeats